MVGTRIFVGRKAELQDWDKVLRSPQGQAVVVVGPQGMGSRSVGLEEFFMSNPLEMF